jgi:hypothetical protein
VSAGLLNESASGSWRAAVGTPVEVLARKNGGRATRVRMPATAPLHAGRSCWVPSAWVDAVPAERKEAS